MLFLCVSNIFIKSAFISKTRANSAKIRSFSESAHLIYLETVEISSAKICVLISVIDKSQFLKAISVIHKLSPINFSDKYCGKFSMGLTMFFFVSQIAKMFS